MFGCRKEQEYNQEESIPQTCILDCPVCQHETVMLVGATDGERYYGILRPFYFGFEHPAWKCATCGTAFVEETRLVKLEVKHD